MCICAYQRVREGEGEQEGGRENEKRQTTNGNNCSLKGKIMGDLPYIFSI